MPRLSGSSARRRSPVNMRQSSQRQLAPVRQRAAPARSYMTFSRIIEVDLATKRSFGSIRRGGTNFTARGFPTLGACRTATRWSVRRLRPLLRGHKRRRIGLGRQSLFRRRTERGKQSRLSRLQIQRRGDREGQSDWRRAMKNTIATGHPLFYPRAKFILKIHRRGTEAAEKEFSIRNTPNSTTPRLCGEYLTIAERQSF